MNKTFKKIKNCFYFQTRLRIFRHPNTFTTSGIIIYDYTETRVHNDLVHQYFNLPIYKTRIVYLTERITRLQITTSNYQLWIKKVLRIIFF